ncbi:MAG TPA: hypothetical protein VEI97_02020 [bacterium]|nr:hypothetical protein [bacterium]
MRILRPLAAGLALATLAAAGCGGSPTHTPEAGTPASKPDPAGRQAMSHLGSSLVGTYDLLAGQHIDAGTITVTNDGSTLSVVYTVDAPWALTEAHLYVGTDPAGKTAPGSFPYKAEHLGGLAEYTFTVPMPNTWVCGTDLLIAAHAVVAQPNGLGGFTTEETGWGAGTIPFQRGWGSYLEYTVAPHCPLPPGAVNFKVLHPGPASYFLTSLLGVGPGYAVQSGSAYTGWCVDLFHFITPGVTYSGHLYSSVGGVLPANLQDDDWDLVNYLINHKQGTRDDIQNAIWYFIGGGGYPSDPDAQAMIAAAQAHGEGFVPGPSQKTAIIVDAGPTVQITIIEVACDC